ncbi:hypothetical protein Q5752_005981 [Cryptotrichosporon argae]
MADVTGHVDGRQSQTGTLDVELLSHAQSPPPKHSSQPSRLQRWREQLKPNVPDPWLQRKLGVIIVFCLAIWIFYVVVGRVCAPMIERKSDTGFSRGAGIGTLCAYLVLWLLFLWNYVKIITSTPGFARDHVSKTRPPSSAPETTYHCIWIGTCVGWANHKFFITFNLWAGLFCIYSFILLVVDAAHASRVDGEVVALIVLTGYFTLFTLLTMLPEHVYLVLSSKTTLESFRGRDQAEAETALLSHEYGWQHLRERKAVRRRWTEEWGGTKVDQRWKWGSSAQMWRQEMGDWWLGWLLPLGRPKGDGLNYRQNARFGPNGEWLRKSDWSQGSPTPARFEQPGA